MNQEDKLDKIIRVVTRTEVQVEQLMAQDLHTRTVKMESAHRFWRALVIAVPSFGGLLFGAIRLYQSM